jgi:mannose-6-phosphate isomerase
MATSDNVLNLGFVPAAEKDSVDLFIDAVTCEPKSGEDYKLSKQQWNLSSGAGATIYKVRHSALQNGILSSQAEAD